MKVSLKKLKIKKLRKVLTANRFFIMCNINSIQAEKLSKFSHEMLKMKLSHCRVNTKLLKNVLRISIFQNYANSIMGSVLLIYSKEDLHSLNLNALLIFLNSYKIVVFGVYLDYNVYSISQVINLPDTNLEKNPRFLLISLNKLLSFSCSTFIKKV
jgi:ribosomal protein L10